MKEERRWAGAALAKVERARSWVAITLIGATTQPQRSWKCKLFRIHFFQEQLFYKKKYQEKLNEWRKHIGIPEEEEAIGQQLARWDHCCHSDKLIT